MFKSFMKNLCYDVVIVGSGAAGLTSAINLAGSSKIALLSKGYLDAGSTAMAQGGIAAVVSQDDNIEAHVADTMNIGGQLCDKQTVEFVIKNASTSIEWLISQGVNFSIMKNGSFHLTREGGHSYRRILHATDATGLEIESKLIKKAHQLPIDIFTEYTAIDLIIQNNKCIGIYAFDNISYDIKIFIAHIVVLATGGASRVYLHSTNPLGNTGDGIAMAWRAGCNIHNMEFNQFHPTYFYCKYPTTHAHHNQFLISEAVRGEGGLLRLPGGDLFMHKFDNRAELAPRDIVARAINCEMKHYDIDCVYLDISHRSKDFIETHFPTIYQLCMQQGIDITKDWIPVVPAAHYTCGGVLVDNKGRTNINGLYAIGETSCTGLHGYNRMASNSLLECIVYGRLIVSDIISVIKKHDYLSPLPEDLQKKFTIIIDKQELLCSYKSEIREIMWNYIGIVCTNKKLSIAGEKINNLAKKINEHFPKNAVSKDFIELKNLIVVANLIIKAAIQRKYNCGLYYNLDYI